MPGVRSPPVVEPIVVHESHGGDSRLSHAFQKAERHSSHRPPGDDIGPEVVQMAVQDTRVVSFDRQGSQDRAPRKPIVSPVPAQISEYSHVISWPVGFAVIRREHTYLVAGGLEVTDRRVPDPLVSAPLVVWRIHVPDGQYSHAPLFNQWLYWELAEPTRTTLPLVLASSSEQILEQAGPDDLILDVGGWASPFGRANWVLDLMPYETRGQYGPERGGPERFASDTWVTRDICARDPWPFADDQFDFVICSHTLEDVRDPVWVCSELARVAKAGYIEVPSRLEEQSYGFQGPWVGWGHHHWLTDLTEDGLEFVFKHHVLQGQPQSQFPETFRQQLTPEQRVLTLWWKDTFTVRERVFLDAEGLDTYLEGFVRENGPSRETKGRWRAGGPLRGTR
jgi:methyltransferase family protein